MGLLLEGTGLFLCWELDRMERNKGDEELLLGIFKWFSYRSTKICDNFFYKNSLQSHLIKQLKGNNNKSRQRDPL